MLMWIALSINDPLEVQDRFDLLELNHYHNENGQPTFVQLILWDWNPSVGRYVSQGYVMLDDAIQKTPEGKKRWDEKVAKFLENKTLQFRADVMGKLEYCGEYVRHPAHPQRMWKQRRWRSRFEKDGVYREITAKIYRETWTGYDPEAWDRRQHPHFIRRGLSKH